MKNIIGVDIGRQNMGLCLLRVNEGELTTYENMPWKVPTFEIVSIKHINPNIDNKDDLGKRASILKNIVNKYIPEDFVADEFRIERQFINHQKSYSINFIALCISQMIFGMLAMRFPNAIGRSVGPPLQGFKGNKPIKSYEAKNIIIRTGKELIQSQARHVRDSVDESADPTHMLEAMFMGLKPH